MKWLSVLALCAALFIAATHSNQLQDDAELIDEADEEKILQMLLADQANAEIEHDDEETVAVYKGRISAAREKANVQCNCRCERRRSRWQKASKAQGNARAQCRCCNGGWLI